MNFLSVQFVLFFLIVISLFHLLPPRFRKGMLLIASYLFYASWNIPFIALIVLTTSVDYFMSKIIHGSPSPLARKSALLGGLAVNLLVLGTFKYSNFLLDTSYGLAHWLHYEPFWPQAINILLPLGISFYTFEAISYMVDVYRGEKPAKSWWAYNFYIMYFPHLISGPIIRYKELAPQCDEPIQKPALQRFSQGVQLLVLGYMFKVLIADSVAPLSDNLFQNYEQASVLTAYVGVLAFTAQIYFDFMGYTHIARGASLLFNIELPLNFNHPYLATNISNFWERWHISLSRWIRDYLYFPLGGSKLGLSHTVSNLLVTMIICGAWHGAGWNFIMWGAYHGVLLAGYHCFRHWKTQAFSSDQVEELNNHPVYRAGTMALTFVLVVIGWVFFRATSLTDATAILGKLFQVPQLMTELAAVAAVQDWTQPAQILVILACCLSGALAVQLATRIHESLPRWLQGQVTAMSCFLALLIVFIKAISAPADIPFIYFQF